MSIKNRYLQREVVFGPYEYGGIGFVALYVMQGVLHVMSVLRQFRMNTGLVANAMHIAYTWTHRVSGTTQGPFEDVDTPLPHLET